MVTKRQIEQAARIWRKALVAHMGIDGDSAQEVREAAITQARDELRRTGLDYGSLRSEADCLAIVVTPNDLSHRDAQGSLRGSGGLTGSATTGGGNDI